MTMTALALIHSSDSDNKVTNEISDCPGIALVSVVKECGPYIPAETCIIGESGIPLHQLFIYVLSVAAVSTRIEWSSCNRDQMAHKA